MLITEMSTSPHYRIAVAEDCVFGTLAPRLGKALRFGLYEVVGKQLRGPWYRVRHGEPHGQCMDHEELQRLLHDCQLVVTGAVGSHMKRRLQEMGVDIVIGDKDRSPRELVEEVARASA